MKTFYLFTIVLLCNPVILFSQKKEFKPEDTEVWNPEPRVVTPGKESNLAPNDAIPLFNGHDTKEWTHAKGEDVKWNVSDGVLTVVAKTGAIVSKQKFGSCQLHLEYKMPVEDDKQGQGRGNSGVFLMGKYEVQILNNFENKTYVNGQCGSIYKQTPPLVNACRPPEEWQTYDIIFNAPVFNKKGKLVNPAYVTVIHNGVLVQNHTEILGASMYIGLPKYIAHAEKESLSIQDHGNAISFRNIWIREL